jgi:hypothetical protein
MDRWTPHASVATHVDTLTVAIDVLEYQLGHVRHWHMHARLRLGRARRTNRHMQAVYTTSDLCSRCKRLMVRATKTCAGRIMNTGYEREMLGP